MLVVESFWLMAMIDGKGRRWRCSVLICLVGEFEVCIDGKTKDDILE